MKSRRRWAGRAARMGDKTGAYRVLVGTPEGKRPLGNPGVDGEGGGVNNKLDLQEVGWTAKDWTDMRLGTDG